MKTYGNMHLLTRIAPFPAIACVGHACMHNLQFPQSVISHNSHHQVRLLRWSGECVWWWKSRSGWYINPFFRIFPIRFYSISLAGTEGLLDLIAFILQQIPQLCDSFSSPWICRIMRTEASLVWWKRQLIGFIRVDGSNYGFCIFHYWRAIADQAPWFPIVSCIRIHDFAFFYFPCP